LEARELLTAVATRSYSVTESWTSGFQAALKLQNNQAPSVSPWRLEFDLAANITSIWNAQIAAHSGNHYAIVGANWNSTLPGSGSVEFGFVASGSATSRPLGYLLNGIALDGSTAPPVPALSTGDVSIIEGNSGTSTAVFTASLSAAATGPVTVSYHTSDGTAQAASDYRSASGTLSFAAGQTTKTITVSILGDTLPEGDEVFYVDLSSPLGATLVRSRAAGTIANDDAAPVSPNFQFKVLNDWGSGFTGQVTMRNAGATPISNWKLDFDFAETITSIWDASIVSHLGNHYTVRNAGYNSAIPAGGTMSFGFNGSPGNVLAGPTNYLLSADSGGPIGQTNRAPVAVDDTAFVLAGQSTNISVLLNDSDPDRDALSLVSVTTPGHGLATINPDASVQYTPQAGYTGADTFSYVVRDASGLTATAKVNLTVSVSGVWPAHVFAPYVDMTLYPTYDLVAAARSQGLRYFSLAFIVASPSNQPAWGGYAEYQIGSAFDAQVKNQIATLRSMGGDVVVSFGGVANRELAEVITDPAALQRAYQAVIDAYGLTHIDFDIEGAALGNRASVDRRNLAIAGLQQAAAVAGRPLDVSYTLPVLPSGLTVDGLYLLQSAVRAGANTSLVNVMAMDYGDSAAPNPAGKMGDYAIAAANSLFSQLKGLYGSRTDAQLWQMVGVTPMIGLNDITSEKFDQQEARELVSFAQQKGIGRVAFWSLNRDQQNAAGAIGYVDNTSSSRLSSPRSST
jgi:hypothetical protein